MPVPTYDQFIEPVLRYLADHPDAALARDVHEAAADALGLSESDRQEILPSGLQAVYKNRAGWACDRLKRAGDVTSLRRGLWKVTPAGMAFVKAHPEPHDVDVHGAGHRVRAVGRGHSVGRRPAARRADDRPRGWRHAPAGERAETGRGLFRVAASRVAGSLHKKISAHARATASVLEHWRCSYSSPGRFNVAGTSARLPVRIASSR